MPGFFYFCLMLKQDIAKALIIDDDSLGCILLKSQLSKMAIFADVASDRDSALKILLQNPDINIAFVDYHLPGITGDKLIKQLLEQRPELRYVIVSGVKPDECELLDIDIDPRCFITKPVTPYKLKKAISVFH
jgi:two-component SAPR family response regulator